MALYLLSAGGSDLGDSHFNVKDDPFTAVCDSGLS